MNVKATTLDGRRVVSGSEDTTLKGWDLEEGSQERTMELADRLYGLTMQEQGVSRLVRVPFDEAMALVIKVNSISR